MLKKNHIRALHFRSLRMILLSSNFRKDRGLCRIVAPNFELSPFVSTLSRTLTICLQSGKTATVAVVGTEGLKMSESEETVTSGMSF